MASDPRAWQAGSNRRCTYVDEAEAEMAEDDPPVRSTRIRLGPQIVASNVSESRVRRYVERAHEGCYIANSLRSEILVEPHVEIRVR